MKRDAHAHFSTSKESPNSTLLKNLDEENFSFVFCGYGYEDNILLAENSQIFKEQKNFLGLHPWYIAEKISNLNFVSAKQKILEIIQDVENIVRKWPNAFVGIGEIGFDFSNNFLLRKLKNFSKEEWESLQFFALRCLSESETLLPFMRKIVLHSVAAKEQTSQFLHDYFKKCNGKALIHGYNGTAQEFETLSHLFNNRTYLSFNPKYAQPFFLQSLSTPLLFSNVLFETDATLIKTNFESYEFRYSKSLLEFASALHLETKDALLHQENILKTFLTMS